MDTTKSLVKIVICSALLGIAGCKKDPYGVLITGLDGNGKMIEASVPSKDYEKQTEKLMNAVSDETFKAINQTEERENKSSWKPTQIIVGLSLSGAIGVGKVLTAGAEPSIEFFFKKETK